jgi:hypothetical protein
MRIQAPPGYKWVKLRDMESTEIITDGVDCYPWHEVFAYWPVKTISGKIVWWKKVFKRKVWVVWGTGFHMEPETQYGTAFDLINYD